MGSDTGESFLAFALGNPQPFVSPQAAYSFVIDLIAVETQVDGCTSPTPTGTLLCKGP